MKVQEGASSAGTFVVLELYAGQRDGTRLRLFDPKRPFKPLLVDGKTFKVVQGSLPSSWQATLLGDIILLRPAEWNVDRFWEQLSFSNIVAGPNASAFSGNILTGAPLDDDYPTIRELYRSVAAAILDEAGLDGHAAFFDDGAQFLAE